MTIYRDHFLIKRIIIIATIRKSKKLKLRKSSIVEVTKLQSNIFMSLFCRNKNCINLGS
jgi:hypothetical protein